MDRTWRFRFCAGEADDVGWMGWRASIRQKYIYVHGWPGSRALNVLSSCKVCAESI